MSSSSSLAALGRTAGHPASCLSSMTISSGFISFTAAGRSNPFRQAMQPRWQPSCRFCGSCFRGCARDARYAWQQRISGWSCRTCISSAMSSWVLLLGSRAASSRSLFGMLPVEPIHPASYRQKATLCKFCRNCAVRVEAGRRKPRSARQSSIVARLSMFGNRRHY